MTREDAELGGVAQRSRALRQRANWITRSPVPTGLYYSTHSPGGVRQ